MPCKGCEERRRLLGAAVNAYHTGFSYQEYLRAMAQSAMDDLKKLALTQQRPAPEDK
jgi:hypothetical protein